MSSNLIQFPGKKTEEVNFKVFAQQVASGDLDKATRSLRDLLKVDFEVAEKACQHFAKAYQSNQGTVLADTMKIRSHIHAGEQNNAMVLIQKNFGLSGHDLVAALEAMKGMA